MKPKKLFLVVTLGWVTLPGISNAQWDTGASFTFAFPMTSYEEVFKNGYGFSVDVRHYFGKGFGVGLETGFTRFVNVKDQTAINVNDPKITVVPIIFIAEYEMNRESFWRPFVAGGLGVSINTFSYYRDAPESSRNQVNAIFTLCPEAGVRFALNKQFMSHIKGNFVLLMDGAPVVMEDGAVIASFPESDKITGYAGISLGFSYRFIRDNN